MEDRNIERMARRNVDTSSRRLRLPSRRAAASERRNLVHCAYVRAYGCGFECGQCHGRRSANCIGLLGELKALGPSLPALVRGARCAPADARTLERSNAQRAPGRDSSSSFTDKLHGQSCGPHPRESVNVNANANVNVKPSPRRPVGGGNIHQVSVRQQ